MRRPSGVRSKVSMGVSVEAGTRTFTGVPAGEGNALRTMLPRSGSNTRIVVEDVVLALDVALFLHPLPESGHVKTVLGERRGLQHADAPDLGRRLRKGDNGRDPEGAERYDCASAIHRPASVNVPIPIHQLT